MGKKRWDEMLNVRNKICLYVGNDGRSTFSVGKVNVLPFKV